MARNLTHQSVTFVGAGAQVASETAAATITPLLPGGTQANDLALAIVAGLPTDATEPATPAGWTKVTTRLREIGANDLRLSVYSRRLTGGDANPGFVLPNSWGGAAAGMSAQILVWRGVDTALEFDADAVLADAAAAATWGAPAITTIRPKAFVVSVVATADDNALGLQTANGFTARASGASYDTTLGGEHAIGVADKEQAAAGVVTMPVWQQTVNGNDAWVGITLALRSASAERSLLGGGHINIHAKLEIRDSDGTWRDLTNLSGQDWLKAWRVEENSDDPVAKATFYLHREIGALSLAPLMEASTINRNAADAYVPLVTPPRLVRFSVAEVANGVAPTGGDYHQIFQGPIFDVDPAESDPYLVVKALDLGHLLGSIQIEAETAYGTAGGSAVEAVMQEIIDDWVGNPPLVTTPTSPGWLITTYNQARVNVMEAVRTLALQIGWDFRYMYPASGDTPELRFFQPPRSKTLPDWSFSGDEYLRIPRAPLSDADVRNAVLVRFVESNGTPSAVTRENAGSIAQFGRRFMEIVEDASSNIDTVAEANALGDAAVSDLGTPPHEHEMETLLFWPVQLHDLIRFAPNGTFYDSNQNQAVVGIKHESGHEPGHATTTLYTRGKPMGAYSEWIRLGSVSVDPKEYSVNVAVSRTPLYQGAVQTGWRLTGTVSEDTRALTVDFDGAATFGTATPAYQLSGGIYWIDLRTTKTWSIDVLIPAGGTGKLTLVPRQIYEPTNGGAAGPSAIVLLERPGVNTHTVRELTETTREVTITVTPATAKVLYRVDAGNWIEDNDGVAVFQVDVEDGDRTVEYYSMTPDGARSEVYRLVIDQNSQPGIASFVLAEASANVLKADLGFDDDVVTWRMWARRGASPKMANGTPDERYLVHDGGVEKTSVEWWAAGAGVAVVDVWHVVVRAYGWSGTFTEDTKTQLVSGAPAAVGALSNIVARYSAGFNVIDWSHNQTAQDNAYTVTVRENTVQLVTARDVKLEPDGGSAQALYGGYRTAKFGANPTDPGAVYLTFDYEIDLRRSSDNALIATYTVSMSGWYMPGGGAAAPTEVPNTLAATGQPDRVVATWVNTTGAWGLKIEWSTSNAEGGPFTVDSVVELPAGTVTAEFLGIAFTWVRFRVIYFNAHGNSSGGWAGPSNAAMIGPVI